MAMPIMALRERATFFAEVGRAPLVLLGELEPVLDPGFDVGFDVGFEVGFDVGFDVAAPAPIAVVIVVTAPPFSVVVTVIVPCALPPVAVFVTMATPPICEAGVAMREAATAWSAGSQIPA